MNYNKSAKSFSDIVFQKKTDYLSLFLHPSTKILSGLLLFKLENCDFQLQYELRASIINNISNTVFLKQKRWGKHLCRNVLFFTKLKA